MTQLILEGVVLPESQRGGYTVSKEPLSSDVEMVTGRIVRELRGNVWTISYQYGYFNDGMKDQVIAACEKGRRQAIRCGFLTPKANSLVYSSFLVTSFTYPKFMWSRNVVQRDTSTEGVVVAQPLWGDFSVQLREVQPSD